MSDTLFGVCLQFIVKLYPYLMYMLCAIDTHKYVYYQQAALVHEENHSFMFCLLFTAIFKKHQYTIKDIYSINTQFCQIVNGKIQCQHTITTLTYGVGNIC